ncbi:hypothetical protein ACQ4N7_29435 [Nodosilinea sp. AN01ver1]|uniref:hypothetical protein n=1 Tax=Nodosilinea sp. AN01ver1 TaxID=3423362 RepID=UPI003D3207CC
MEQPKELTGGDLRKARLKALEDKNIIYGCPFETIAKNFLKEFLGYAVFTKLSFNEIRDRYITKFNRFLTGTPDKEDAFYKFICSEYLELDKEPRTCLLSLYQGATKDLLQIKENINKCDSKPKDSEKKSGSQAKKDESNQKKQDLEKKSSSQSNEGESDYKKSLLEYYKNLNIAARDEIIEFITSEEIYGLALRRAYKNTFALPDFHVAYSYLSNPARYDPDNFSEISNKFLDLPHARFREINDLYKNNRNEFYRQAFYYIKEHKVIDEIRQRIRSNHILNERRDILLPALDTYEENKQIFVNLIPLQIEGLFYEYCLAVDVPENKLQLPALGEKLDKIKSRNSGFYDFEYFKFVFPVTRNRVAHGKMIASGDLEKVAAFMLLDLADVTERIVTDALPINTILLALKRVQNGRPCFDEDLVRIAFFMANKKELPPFYSLNDSLQTIKAQFSGDHFFGFAKRLSQVDDYTLLVGLKMALGWLKKENSSLKVKCVEVFREIHKTEQRLDENEKSSKHRGHISLFDFFSKVDQALEILPDLS